MHNEIVANALRRRLADVRSRLDDVSSSTAPETTRFDGEVEPEETLRRLMTGDRAKIERGENTELQDVLKRLDMIAGHAVVSSDLRYLDALNYYYELPVAIPSSILKQYSDALSAHIDRLCESAS